MSYFLHEHTTGGNNFMSFTGNKKFNFIHTHKNNCAPVASVHTVAGNNNFRSLKCNGS